MGSYKLSSVILMKISSHLSRLNIAIKFNQSTRSKNSEQLLVKITFELLDLSVYKVYKTFNITIKLVSFYLTFSPLPKLGGLFSVALSVLKKETFQLGSIMLYTVRTFLFIIFYEAIRQLTLTKVCIFL